MKCSFTANASGCCILLALLAVCQSDIPHQYPESVGSSIKLDGNILRALEVAVASLKEETVTHPDQRMLENYETVVEENATTYLVRFSSRFIKTDEPPFFKSLRAINLHVEVDKATWMVIKKVRFK